MSEIHVIFGTGPLGRWTAKALIQMDKTVRMVNRSGMVSDPLPGVEVTASDAYDTARAIEVTRGAATVYQCAQPHYEEAFGLSATPLKEAIAKTLRWCREAGKAAEPVQKTPEFFPASDGAA